MDMTYANGLAAVLQSIDLRLTQTELHARIRRALTLLHRLRRYYDAGGTRCGIPSLVEGAEALFASHSVADEGDDMVSENTNADSLFVDQWWKQLRPLLPAPVRTTAAEVIAACDSAEPIRISDTLADSGGLPNQSGSQDQWEAEELRAWQADAKSMMDSWDDQDRLQEQQRRDTVQAKEWDDWAMHDAMQSGKEPKRRRLLVQTFNSLDRGSGPASFHEIPIPEHGVRLVQVVLEMPPSSDSDASTIPVSRAPEPPAPSGGTGESGGDGAWPPGALRDLPGGPQGVVSLESLEGGGSAELGNEVVLGERGPRREGGDDDDDVETVLERQSY